MHVLKLHSFTQMGATFGIVNIVIAIYLIAGHVLNWSRPLEQKQYVDRRGAVGIVKKTSLINGIAKLA